MFDRASPRRARVPLIAFGAVALLASAVNATTMPERSAAEVADASALVVEATALDARTVWVRGRIVTFTELRIERVLRSSEVTAPGALVTVALPGGEVGGIAQKVPGSPALRTGSRYLLCLSPEVLAGARAVIGLWQGAWLVQGGAVHAFTHAGVAPTPSPRSSLERALAGAP